MRFSEQRKTFFKGMLIPDNLVATPRIIADPVELAFVPVANRASRRKGKRGRVGRPTLNGFEKHWRRND